MDTLDWQKNPLNVVVWWKKSSFCVCVKVELYRMVRQFHLRTQGGHDSSASHPDIIGDRCVSIQIKTNKKPGCLTFIRPYADVSARVWRYAPSTASFWRTSWACAAACWASLTSALLPSDARPAGYLPWEINILLNLGTHRWENTQTE